MTEPEALPDVTTVLDGALAEMPSARLTLDGAVSVRIRPTERAQPSDQAPAPPPTGGTAAQIRYLATLVRSAGSGLAAGIEPVVIGIASPSTQHQEDPTVPTAPDSATRADSYLIALPPGWVEQPIEAPAFERTLSEQIADLRAAGVSRPDARRFELLQRQIHRQILTGDVQFVATLASRIGAGDPTGGDEDRVSDLLLAGAVVTTRTRADLGAPAPITASMLLQGFRTAQDDPGDVSLEEPRVVDLPGGPALRLVRFHSERAVASNRAEQVEYYEHSYLLPQDGGERVGFLQLVTPSLGYCEPLADLFDAIATTFRVLYAEDPTDFDAAAGVEASTGAEPGRPE